MKEKKLLTIMIGMRRTGENMQPDEDDDEKFVPITFEEACDEFTDMHDKAGTLPDGDDIDENIEWGTNQLEYAHEAVEFGEERAAIEEQIAEDEWQQEIQEAQSGGGFNTDEENWEAEDMPGDNADERSESYDNWDYDAADG